MSANLEIQNAFLEGIEEAFSIMFTEETELRFLSDETEVNIYDEATEKKYGEPIKLVAKVKTDFVQGDLPIQGVQIDAIFSVPTKQLISNNVDRVTLSDLETLRKCKFSYAGLDYLVKKVQPRTLIADEWHIYDFYCAIESQSSLKGSDDSGEEIS